MRGFKSHQIKPEIVNLKDLRTKFKDGDKINPAVLLEKGLIDTIKRGVKILGKGEIAVKIEVTGCALSKSAKAAIEKTGGKII